MNKIGDIKPHNKNCAGTYIWYPCADCGKERWAAFSHGKPRNLRCPRCANKLKAITKFGSANHNWKGGRWKSQRGYISVRILPDDFFYPMARGQGRVQEHRLVMAKHLGRNLHSWEIVHHINHDKTDNRIENLQLVTNERHKQITILENEIRYLEKENDNLKQILKDHGLGIYFKNGNNH